jgi:hypothetical protein
LGEAEQLAALVADLSALLGWAIAAALLVDTRDF